MNNLSWLLYFAEVAPRLWIIGFLSSLFSGAVLLLLMIGFITETPKRDERATVLFVMKVSSVVFLISMVFAIFTPTKETIYLIAGSAADRYVAQTETGQEILNDVKNVIQLQLKNLQQ